MKSAEPRKIYSVSQLNRSSKQVLEANFGLIWLRGELSNCALPRSGHWYFSLKDENAQVRAAMFRGKNQFAKVKPKDGLEVLVRAKVSLFEPRGDYQLIVEYIEDAGIGKLQRQFEALKEKLSSEGLFDTARKKPLPDPIHRLGVLTSPSGAAIKDVLHVLRRRAPTMQVIIYPCLVQGKEAAKDICNALAIAQRRNECDALLLTRGGGSLEDLFAFNDENLARAIAASKLPTISAVGHEIDFTISDFVADLRAPTPSAAAEILSINRAEKIKQLLVIQQRLKRCIDQLLQQKNQLLDFLLSRLKHPSEIIEKKQEKVTALLERLHWLTLHKLEKSGTRFEHMQFRLANCSPQDKIEFNQNAVQNILVSLLREIRRNLQNQENKLSHFAVKLDALSPLKTLARGYSISLINDKILTKIDESYVNESMTTIVEGGEIISQVQSVKRKEKQQKLL